MVKIDKGVPIPPMSKNEAGGRRKYPFAELEIGESFFVTNRSPSTIAASWNYARKRTGFNFLARTIDGGVRVWRIE